MPATRLPHLGTLGITFQTFPILPASEGELFSNTGCAFPYESKRLPLPSS